MIRAAESVLSYTFDHRDTLGSTNAEAVALARAGAVHGTVVSAARQTEGRGRHGRSWQSPEGNLYLSVLLRPDCPLQHAAQLGFVAAVAVAETLAPLLPASAAPECKWPNDVLAAGGKIAGILLETAGQQGHAPVGWVVLGIGINVAAAPDAPREGGAGLPAVALADFAAKPPGPAALRDGLLSAFARRYADWQAGGFPPIRNAWLARSRPCGSAIEVRLPRQRLTGLFEEIDAGGALVMSTADGTRRTVAAGDVFFPDAGG
jgi:BirA family biotin operon repressor/biotin-[acetyl-CoA-carboxylase] ligase